MKKWRCKICGEIVEGDAAPEKCPLCKAPAEKFEEVVESEMTWAAELSRDFLRDISANNREISHQNQNLICDNIKENGERNLAVF